MLNIQKYNYAIGHEDGYLQGSVVPIEDKLRKSLSVIFQESIKSGQIDSKKKALEFCDNSLTFEQVYLNTE